MCVMGALGVQAKWRRAKKGDLESAFRDRDNSVLLGARVLQGQRPFPATPGVGPYDDPWGRTSMDGDVAKVYDVKWIMAVKEQKSEVKWKESDSAFVVDDAVSEAKWKKVAGAGAQQPTAAERHKYNVRGQRISSNMLSVFTGTVDEWVQEAKNQDLGVKKRKSTVEDTEVDKYVLESARRGRGRGYAGRGRGAAAGRPSRASTAGASLR